jgi:S-formylglutathione hydrolase
MTGQIETRSNHACFGGEMGFYSHQSSETKTPMNFSIFTPPQAKDGKVPALVYLAGLTCTEETFMIKAGAQKIAADLGLALICPDTSPRGAGIEGEDDSWDFGTGAGFYLDATNAPWSANYRMYSYITKELPALLTQHYPAIEMDRLGLFGHSMGGHGALTIHLKNPDLFKTISAFAPIAAPMRCPWGNKAFSNYLGPDQESWKQYDASELVRTRGDGPAILIDQGLADGFLEQELHPHHFEAACAKAGRAVTVRRHEGYDHGYYFIASFMEDHLRHHAAGL